MVGKGQQKNNPGHNGNHGGQNNGGKRKHPEGGSYLVAKTNTGFRGQRRNNSGRSFNANKDRNFEEALKGLCPKHSTPNRPASHSLENYDIMQAYCNQLLQNHPWRWWWLGFCLGKFL